MGKIQGHAGFEVMSDLSCEFLTGAGIQGRAKEAAFLVRFPPSLHMTLFYLRSTILGDYFAGMKESELILHLI